MYRCIGILFVLISFDLLAQEIPDYKGEYVFTNSRVSMKGIRELITHEEAGKRTIQFNAKFPLGKIKIISDFSEKNNLISSIKYFIMVIISSVVKTCLSIPISKPSFLFIRYLPTSPKLYRCSEKNNLSIIPLAVSSSGGSASVSYTHLTLPTNREV